MPEGEQNACGLLLAIWTVFSTLWCLPGNKKLAVFTMIFVRCYGHNSKLGIFSLWYELASEIVFQPLCLLWNRVKVRSSAAPLSSILRVRSWGAGPTWLTPRGTPRKLPSSWSPRWRPWRASKCRSVSLERAAGNRGCVTWGLVGFVISWWVIDGSDAVPFFLSLGLSGRKLVNVKG